MATKRNSKGVSAAKPRASRQASPTLTSRRKKSTGSSKRGRNDAGIDNSLDLPSILGLAEETPSPPRHSPSGEVPDTRKWYRLRQDWPFPVDIGALMFDQDTGALKGVGVYLRIPIPWEDYLVEWPSEEETHGKQEEQKAPPAGKLPGRAD